MSLPKMIMLLAGAFVFTVVAAVWPAAAQSPSAQEQREAQIKKCQHRFDRRDANRDGVLSMEEFMVRREGKPKLDKAFYSKDVDNSGALTAEEFCDGRRRAMRVTQ
jgi:Ca2+-binding EF-hand superfamily protein